MNKSIAIFAIMSFAWPRAVYAQFGGFGIPGFGGGGLNAITDQAKQRAVSAIFDDVSKNAFEGGKLILSKKQWACKRMADAEIILTAINKPSLAGQASGLKAKLFCDITEAIPEEFLAPAKKEVDEQEIL